MYRLLATVTNGNEQDQVTLKVNVFNQVICYVVTRTFQNESNGNEYR